MTTRLEPGMTAPNFTFDTPHEQNHDFLRDAGGAPSVLFFLRYMGCPLCQLRISEIVRDRDLFERAGYRVFVVLQSEPRVVSAAMTGEMPFTVICDPGERIFSLYHVAPGGILGYIAPSVIMKALRASKAGFRHGAKEGRELQLPAVFIIDAAGKIAFAYYGKNIGDLPGNTALMEVLNGN